MPIFIPTKINTTLNFGQHYRKGSLVPGKKVYQGGICLGLTLSWIRLVHVRSDIRCAPPLMEGILGQYIAEYGFSTRKYANSDIIDERQEAAEFLEYARNYRPGESVMDQELGNTCRRLGLSNQYVGELNPFRILYILNALRGSQGVKTWLLSDSAHATALAMQNGHISFFDSNKEITVFSVEEAIDNAQLMHYLNVYLNDSPHRVFGVAQIDY